MRCEEVQDLASAWLDNELSEAHAGAFADHEAHCDACHAYVTDLRLLAEQMLDAAALRELLAKKW